MDSRVEDHTRLYCWEKRAKALKLVKRALSGADVQADSAPGHSGL